MNLILFSHLDTNGDGVLDEQELEALFTKEVMFHLWGRWIIAICYWQWWKPLYAVTESAVKTLVGSSGCHEQNIINIGIHDGTFDEAHKSCSWHAENEQMASTFLMGSSFLFYCLSWRRCMIPRMKRMTWWRWRRRGWGCENTSCKT